MRITLNIMTHNSDIIQVQVHVWVLISVIYLQLLHHPSLGTDQLKINRIIPDIEHGSRA